MNIQDLINILLKLPPDLPVNHRNDDGFEIAMKSGGVQVINGDGVYPTRVCLARNAENANLFYIPWDEWLEANT